MYCINLHRTDICQDHQFLMRRATSLIHTSEIKILLNIPLITLVLIFVNVKTLVDHVNQCYF